MSHSKSHNVRIGRLVAMALAMACWSLPSQAQVKMEMTTDFADMNVVGGTKMISKDFSRFPKWDRIRQLLLKHGDYNAAALQEWLSWAEGLRDKPARDRLAAIHTRVNKSFPYKTDPRIWKKSDYWEDPREIVKKGAIDCEGYAIFKYYLAMAAGIERMGVLIGRIRSTREFHAILAALADGNIYILDNRKGYMIDIDAERDFSAFYSVGLGEIWVYPQKKALKKKK